MLAARPDLLEALLLARSRGIFQRAISTGESVWDRAAGLHPADEPRRDLPFHAGAARDGSRARGYARPSWRVNVRCRAPGSRYRLPEPDPVRRTLRLNRSVSVGVAVLAALVVAGCGAQFDIKKFHGSTDELYAMSLPGVPAASLG